MKVVRLAALLAPAAVAAAALGAVALAGTVKLEHFAPTAADQRLAAKVALRRSDLPGSWDFTSSKRPTAGDKLTCPGHAPDFSRFTKTGHAEGLFSAQGQEVASMVEVFRTAEDAAQDFKLGTEAASWSCLRSKLERELRTGAAGMSVSTSRWKVTHAAPNEYEATGAFTIKGPAGAVQIVFDFVGVLAGRGNVSLMMMTPAAKPIPEAAALARTLGQRARLLLP
jgi:hypothetical protein